MELHILFLKVPEKMTGEWFHIIVEEMRNSGCGRGNLRTNCGCNITWRVDRTILSDMSIPIALQQSAMYAYNPPNGDDDMISDGESSDLTMHNTLADTIYALEITLEINGGDSIHYDTQQRLQWATRTVEDILERILSVCMG